MKRTNKIEREKQRRSERQQKEQLRKDLLGMLEQQREASIQAARRIPQAIYWDKADEIRRDSFSVKVR